MGLFGSKTKTTVGTSVQRVIDNNAIPDSILEGFTSDMVNGGGQTIEYIKDNIANSIALRCNRMYNFGKKSYVWGLPTGQAYSSYAAKEAVKAVIELTEGSPVQINYYHFGPLNNMHIAWKELTEEYGYDYVSNKIIGLAQHDGNNTYDVYLKDMQLIVTDATLEEAANGSLDQWGVPPNSGPTPSKKIGTNVGSLKGATPFATDPNASGDYIIVTYEWEIPPTAPATKPEIKTGVINIPMDGYDYTKDYHMAGWTKGSKRGYFVYQYGSGDLAIDKVFDAEYNDQGNFFPLLYFRYDKKSDAADKQSITYKHAKKLSDYLNIDYDDLVNNVHSNPDINDVQQGFMMMGVHAKTTNDIERKYLFDFFFGMYQKTKSFNNSSPLSDNFNVLSNLNAEMNQSSIIIQDKRFKMALQWRNIIKRKVAGKFGAKGAYLSGSGSVPSSMLVPSLDGSTTTWDTSTTSHWYQYQVTETVYEEILVFGLKMVYYIIDGYTTTGDENNEEILLIPVDISIAKGYSIVEREELYSRSLHYVFNSVVVTKLKWYETGLFRFIMVVIAIVITIFSYGSTWQTIGAALAAGTITITAVIMAFIQEIVKMLIIQLAIKMFVQATNWKFAMVVAMIVAAAYGYEFISGESFSNVVTSKDLLTISTGLAKEANRELSMELLAVSNEISNFVKESQEQLETLKSKTEDLLNENNRLAPLVIFGESPQQFYDRTTHYGNIGALTLDVVTNYVDASLRLPEISDTIKGVQNG